MYLYSTKTTFLKAIAAPSGFETPVLETLETMRHNRDMITGPLGHQCLTITKPEFSQKHL